MSALIEINRYSRVLANSDPQEGPARLGHGEGVHYVAAISKDGKERIKLDELLAITERFFHQACDAEGVSQSERAAELRRLDEALLEYDSKLHNKGARRTLHWLLKLVPGTAAHKVWQLHKKIRGAEEPLTRTIANMNKATASMREQIRERSRSIPHRLQQIYARNAHRWKKRLPELEGSGQASTIETVAAELEEAAQDHERYTPEECEQLWRAAAQLRFAGQIAADGLRRSFEHTNADAAEKVLERFPRLGPHIIRRRPDLQQHPLLGRETAYKIRRALAKLQPGRSLILPGGYAQAPGEREETDIGGHALLYRINGTSGSTYSFEVINTGEGIADEHEPATGPGSAGWVYDKVYVGQTLEQLSIEFFEGLLDFRQPDDADHSIRGLYDYLNQHLGDKIETGRMHKVQEKGICAWKVISTWLKDELGPILHAKYRRDGSDRDLDYLDKLRARQEKEELPITPKELNKLYKQAVRKGYKRSQKLDRLVAETKGLKAKGHSTG